VGIEKGKDFEQFPEEHNETSTVDLSWSSCRDRTQQSIYDGKALVADFYGGANEMRGIGRPISLHNTRPFPATRTGRP
jgi:hypothetical protein